MHKSGSTGIEIFINSPKIQKNIYFQGMPTVWIQSKKMPCQGIIQQKYAFATFQALSAMNVECFSQGSIKINDKQTKENLRVSVYLKG